MFNPKVYFAKFLRSSPIPIGLVVVVSRRISCFSYAWSSPVLLPIIFPSIIPRRNSFSYLKTRLIAFCLLLCLIVPSISRVSFVSLRQPSFVLRVQHFFASFAYPETFERLSHPMRLTPEFHVHTVTQTRILCASAVSVYGRLLTFANAHFVRFCHTPAVLFKNNISH